MLEVLLESTPDSVIKSLRFAQALAKEGLESLSADRNVSLALYLMLILLLAEQDNILQESSCKRNLVWARNTGDGKVIFALLEEIVTLRMSFILINVQELNFQRPLTWAFIVWNGSNNGNRNRCRRSKIQNGPEDPLELIFQVSNHKRVGKARNSNRSIDSYNSGSKNTCCGKSRGVTVAILGGSSANKFVFAVKKRILARTATSIGLSHQAGWVGAFERS